jgi:lysophospholipase L1-like esterase
MRRYILSFLGIMMFTGVMATPMAHGSASIAGGTLESGTGSATATSVRAQPTPTRNAQTPNQIQNGAVYVAMGDSVAAGAGLPALSGATAQDETCDRSSQAYPYQIAERLQTTVVHLACNGAKVDEGIYGTQVRAGVRIPAQLPIAFTNGTPDIITATIGANDIRWTQFIRQCYITRCGFAVDSARAKVYRADVRIELTRMLNQINTRSAGNPPRVLLSGYYSPIDSTECLANNRITVAEVAWLNDQTVRMNQAIRSVVPLFNFAEFVPIDFTGHEVCSADPWVQGLEADAPIHPTAAGQTAIAESFLGALGR